MQKTSKEIIGKIKEILAEHEGLLTDNRVIELYEDITDSITETNIDYKAEYDKLSEESEKKIKEIELEWKQKYIDRFTSTDTEDETKDKEQEDEEENVKTNFKDLFE